MEGVGMGVLWGTADGQSNAPTLFSACTAMLGASMSRRSRSASYLRSLETLNLEGEGQWVLGLLPQAGHTRPSFRGYPHHRDFLRPRR